MACDDVNSDNNWITNRQQCVSHQTTLPLLQNEEEQNFIKSKHDIVNKNMQKLRNYFRFHIERFLVGNKKINDIWLWEDRIKRDFAV